MVIGNGMIGKRFRAFEMDGILVFASGVSNSKSSSLNEYAREVCLVKEALEKYKNNLFVYFSTYSIDDPDLKNTLYVLHKQHIEEIISNNADNYLIIRTSNIAGNNPYNHNTVLNFFYNKIMNG